ncbi:MarR family transcriptional regulator [Alteromonadaceae bacterium M269]|nr:MarR family transcriptional regulator [Alteromonadaceae bacterium M269]
MDKKRTIHEVAFRLSYDLTTQIAPKLSNLKTKPSPLQLRAMRQIWTNNNSTLLDLAKTLKRDKGQVTRLVGELCDMQLVERIPNPNDGRSKLLSLTKKGHEFFTSIEKIEEEFSERLKVGISQEDLDTFFAVSDKLSENLRELVDPN